MSFSDCHFTLQSSPNLNWGICHIKELSFQFPADKLCMLLITTTLSSLSPGHHHFEIWVTKINFRAGKKW